MDSDFRFRPITNFGPISAKNWSKWAQNFLKFFIYNCLFFRDESNGVKIKALSLLVKILVLAAFFAP